MDFDFAFFEDAHPRKRSRDECDLDIYCPKKSPRVDSGFHSPASSFDFMEDGIVEVHGSLKYQLESLACSYSETDYCWNVDDDDKVFSRRCSSAGPDFNPSSAKSTNLEEISPLTFSFENLNIELGGVDLENIDVDKLEDSGQFHRGQFLRGRLPVEQFESVKDRCYNVASCSEYFNVWYTSVDSHPTDWSFIADFSSEMVHKEEPCSSGSEYLNSSSGSGSTSSDLPLLPPCRVCEEPASGLHYGVNTCEACKGFFRRCLHRKDAFKCVGKQPCVIRPGQRSACAACRYQKCLDVGMSKKAIKTGRYTHAKKTRDTVEVKELRKVKFASTILESNEKEIQSIVDQISNLAKVIDRHPPDFDSIALKSQQEFMEEEKARTTVFGSLEPVSMEEYKAFFSQTGVDLDDRRRLVMGWQHELVQWIEKFVSFCKGLPAFQTLGLDEQTAMVKGGRFEVWFMCVYRGVSLDHDIFTMHSGRTFTLKQFAKIWDEDFCHEMFKICRKFKKLNLTDTERALLKALVMLYTDRYPLKNPKTIDDWQILIAQALDYELKKNHPSAYHLFGRILSYLPLVRHLSELNIKVISQIRVDWPEINQQPLWCEVFTM